MQTIQNLYITNHVTMAHPNDPHMSLSRIWTIAVIILIFLAQSCKKDDATEPTTATPTPPSSSVTLLIEPHIDGVDLRFDTMMYITQNDLTFSVSRAEYYISRIVMLGTSGTPNDTLHGPFHMASATAKEFSLGALAAGEYSGAELLLGLMPAQNVTGGLPNTMDNINMAWPDPMGGGYHFIKFEGHFINNGASAGFAIHIGNNMNLPRANMMEPFALDGGSGTLALRFNLNELFRTPNDYDLANGNYSMGSMALMTQLKENAADAFTLEYRP